MTHRSKSQKALAVLLSLIMVFGNIGLCAVLFGTTALAGSAPKEASVTSGDVTFVVPEAIYLYPNGSSWKDTTSSPFQYYVNNTSTGGVDNSVREAQDVGKIYFKYDQVDGEANLSYAFSGNGGTANLNKWTVASGGSVDITGGMSSQLPANVTGEYILWKATFRDRADGQTKTALAYTYVYKPYVVPVGAFLRAKNTCQIDSFAQQVTWISGVHAIAPQTSVTHDGNFYPNYSGDYGFSAFITKGAYGYVGGDRYNAGGFNSSGWTSRASGAAAWNLAFLNTGADVAHFDDTNDHDNSSSTSWGSGSAGGAAFDVASFDYKTYEAGEWKISGSIQNCLAAVYATPYGKITLDTSRIRNLTQVPNLGIGMMITDNQESDSGNWYIADYTRDSSFTNPLLSRTGTSEATDSSSNTRSAHYNDRNYIIAGQGTSSWNSWGDYDAEGVRYAGAWPRTTVSGSTATYAVKGSYATNDGGDYSFTHGIVSLEATQYDKSALRTAVNNAIKAMAKLGMGDEFSSLYFENNDNYKWTAFVNAYQAAAQALAKVDLTDVNVDTLASNLNNALNALCTSVKLDANGGTLSESVRYYTVGTNQKITITLPGDVTASRPDCILYGWSTDKYATCNDENVRIGDTVTLGYNETLYAVWKPARCTVNFAANDKTGGSTASMELLADTPRALTPNGFVREYTVNFNTGTGGTVAADSATHAWTFAGWSKDSNWSGDEADLFADRQVVENISTSTNCTLYAQWKNGAMILPDGVAEGSNNILEGWYTAPRGNSGSKRVGAPGEEYVVDHDQTLYASWAPAEYTVTYIDRDTTYPAEVYMDTDMGHQLWAKPADDPAGFTWGGWELTKTGSGCNWVDILGPGPYHVNPTPVILLNGQGLKGNVTLTAKWIPEQYEITVNIDDTLGAVSNVPASVDRGGEYLIDLALADGYDREAPDVTAENADVEVIGEPGAYQVKVTNVSGDVVVNVAPKANVYYLTVTGDDGFLTADSGKSCAAGETLEFTVTLLPAYNKTAPVVVKDGETAPMTPVAGPDANNAYTYQIESVTADVTVSVTTQMNVYTFTFKNEDGSVTYGSVDVEHGETPIYNYQPSKDEDAQNTYSFVGWSETEGGEGIIDFPAAVKDTVYYAVFATTVKEYLVTFMDENGEERLHSESLPYGSQIVYNGGNPAKAPDEMYSYRFKGWAAEIGGDVIDPLPTITQDVTYYACFTAIAKSFTVTFADEDGTVLKTSTVRGGTVPTYTGPTLTKPSTNPAVTYELDGWSDTQGGEKLESLPPVSGDTTYYAVYKEVPAKYTVTFANYNGARITAEQYVYGSTDVDYHGDTPVRVADAQYSYTFKGWAKAPDGELVTSFDEVTGNITYYAVYEGTPRSYTVTFKDDNNNVIRTDTVAYGDTPVFEGKPIRPSEGNWHYVFERWNADFAPVTSDVTYIAIFTRGSHNWDNYTMAPGFKCTDGGTGIYTCACGETKTETILPTAHKYSAWTVVRPATETEPGLERRVCSACGDVDENVLPVLANNDHCTGGVPHTWGAWFVVVEPTNDLHGLERRQCTVCSSIQERSTANLAEGTSPTPIAKRASIFDWLFSLFERIKAFFMNIFN